MKKIFCQFTLLVEGLKRWSMFRSICLVALLCAMSNLLFLTIFHQVTKEIPSVSKISLIFWTYSLPFSVSRMWDLFLLPPFIVVMYKIHDLNDNYISDYFGSLNDDIVDPDALYGLYAFLGLSFLVSFMGGIIFGVLYAPIFFVIGSVLFVLYVLVYAIVINFEYYSTHNH